MTSVLVIVQIVLQFSAVYLSFVIYRYDRLSKAWLALTIALFFMGLRRLYTLGTELNVLGSPADTLGVVDRIVLPIFVSAFLAWGLWSMKNDFERFEVVQKAAADKAAKFKRHRR
jgi:hypothetical protein